MIQHLFKITWSRKQRNLFLLFQISIVFFVLTFFFTILVNMYQDYWKPLEFSDKASQIYSLNADNDLIGPRYIEKKDALLATAKRVKQNLLAMEEVEGISFSTNLSQPYSFSRSFPRPIFFEDQRSEGMEFSADDDFNTVIGLKMIEGTWFNMSHNSLKLRPLVISKTLADSLFKEKPAIGKTVTQKFPGGYESNYEVIGICEDYRTGEFQKANPSFFYRNDPNMAKRPSSSGELFGMNLAGGIEITVKLKSENQPANIEERLMKTAEKSIPEAEKADWKFFIKSFEKMKKKGNAEEYERTLHVFLLLTFLLLNIAIGFIGVIYYGIAKRRSEIGIRRAVGATKSKIYSIILGEALLVAILGIILGFIFTVQLWYFKVIPHGSTIFIQATLLATAVILLIIFFAAMFPAIKASNIDPAIALKDE
ncbi:ABC transporter permease [Flavivirga rizhaonensis]|uniref:FtsX-like permease family protein n=1 Tax=Flavivirga rizhaonensis TaxID=2559571 RepID=A0A4S1E2X5_9FLAO|nr:FtsX-like permease family protein [Flavivirga rizhaonensis]TGV04703.1 FtsX-like permease family protein [Flavivirga rizhaonensis]